MKILIVEDERELAEALAALLGKNGYTAEVAGDGESGEDLAATGMYDLVVLDVMLPKKDGFSVVRDLREQGVSTPVLLLTAKSELDDKVVGLDHGADDYLTKPFSTRELMARVRALTRRKGEYVGQEITVGNTTLHLLSHEVSGDKNRVKLGQKEFEILELLMSNLNQIIPKDRIMEKVWGFDSDAEYNAIEVYISFIRKKLVSVGADIAINVVRGAGYIVEKNE